MERSGQTDDQRLNEVAGVAVDLIEVALHSTEALRVTVVEHNEDSMRCSVVAAVWGPENDCCRNVLPNLQKSSNGRAESWVTSFYCKTHHSIVAAI